MSVPYQQNQQPPPKKPIFGPGGGGMDPQVPFPLGPGGTWANGPEMTAQAPGLIPANTPSNPNDPFAASGGGVQLPGGGWVPKSHPLAQQAAPQPAAPGAPTGPTGPQGQPTNQQQVLNTTATAGAPTPQGAPTTVAQAFQQALVNRLAPQDITSQNPAIKGSIAANRNAESRGLRQTQEALAERAASTGQTGAQETGLRRAIGESAGRQGAFEGNALFGLHQQQAADLRDAMSLGGNLLSDQQRQELQRYGVDLDAQLRREGLGVQRDLGGRELDIRNTLGLGQLDLGRLGLAQNESQFGRSLGANLGIEQARLNQQALLNLLAGL